MPQGEESILWYVHYLINDRADLVFCMAIATLLVRIKLCCLKRAGSIIHSDVSMISFQLQPFTLARVISNE